MHQLESLGFLLLTNIQDYDEQHLLHWTKWFFSLPQHTLKLLSRKQFREQSNNIYRGLVPFLDNDPSHKEFFEVGLDYSKVSEEEK